MPRSTGSHVQNVFRGHRYGYGRRPVTYGIGSFVVIVSTIVSLSVTLHYKLSTRSGGDDFYGLHYAPVDTRIIPTNAFCQGLTLRIDQSYYSYRVSLYTLRSPPNLTGHEIFSIDKSVDLSLYDYRYYFYYYMYEGSIITVSACAVEELPSDTSITFYLIKGNNTFNKWKDYDDSRTVDSFEIPNMCSTGVNTTYNYTINSTDYYFMAFSVPDEYIYTQHVRMYFYMNRTLYKFTNESIINSCSLVAEDFYDETRSCSVSSPISGSTSLLTVQLPENSQDVSIDFTDGIIARTSCRPRVWLYAVISVASFLTCVVLLVVLVISFCLCTRKNKSSKNDYNVLVTPPPPVNPDYHYANYGSTHDAPPVYTTK